MKQRERQLPCSQEKDNNSELFKKEGRRVALSRKTAKNDALPKGWRWVKLGDIYNISASGDLDAKATSSTQDEKHPYPIYSNALTNKGLHSYSSYAKYDEDSITITARGDVGFANHRTTKFMAIGRLLVLKNKVSISNKFVCEYINHRVIFFKETTGVPQLTAPQASKYHVILPSLPEQKAIASLLETWDTAIEKTEALIAAKEKQFKWLLKTLISDQQDNPEWRRMMLGDICTFEYGKPLKEQDRIGNQYPVFGSNGIVGGHNEYLVVGPFIVIGRKGSAGTVLYSMNNGFPIDTTFYINLQSKEVHLRFLYYLLLLVELNKISAQSGVPGLNRNDAYKISISMPSFVEQREITRILDVANCETDLLKQLAEQYRTQKRGLMQKLLTGKWLLKKDQSDSNTEGKK